MNRWAAMLADLPAELQRVICRANRISLPRRCDRAERLRRMRISLCHAATVRVTYAALEPEAQAALQELRQCKGGLTQDELQQRYGTLRPVAQIAADRRPISLAERLLLNGWLLPRPPAAARNPDRWRGPARYLLPPELRRWLPQPLVVATHGAAPPAGLPPALRAAAALLLAAADRPLDACADGRLRRICLRLLARRLVPLPAAESGDLCQFILPLLADMGMLARRDDTWMPTPVAARFLALPLAEQQARLLHAWHNSPTHDAWLLALLTDSAGMDWPLLRWRLCAWVAALPADVLLDPAGLYAALAAAFGPLADSRTHGYRYVKKVPWQPPRAAAIFSAALRGPLHWLGLVVWVEQSPAPGSRSLVFRPVPDHDSVRDNPPVQDSRDLDMGSCGQIARVRVRPRSSASQDPPHESIRDEVHLPPWRYGQPGELAIPHAAGSTDLLRLLPFARWQSADAEASTYRVTPATLAAATAAGRSTQMLRELLVQRAGPLPAGWDAALDGDMATVRIVHAAIALADPPAALDRVASDRTVRRRSTRLAPGVALVAPEDAPALVRALGRRGVAASEQGRVPAGPPSALGAGDSATLLMACAFYRRHAPPDAALLPDAGLEQRLRAALSPRLRAALDTALDQLDAELDRDAPDPPAVPPPDPRIALNDAMACLNTALKRGRAVELIYDTGGQGDWHRRIVRPLDIEQRYGDWYLRAYCTLRQAERTFRVDRIGAARVVGT